MIKIKKKNKIFFELNFSIPKYWLSLIATLFLSFTLIFHYSSNNFKFISKYKFIVLIGDNHNSNLSFEQHLSLAPIFTFKNNIQNLVSLNTNKNDLIHLDLVFFEIFTNNLLKISQNDNFLTKEKINLNNEKKIIFFEKIFYNNELDNEKKKYIEANIQTLIDRVKEESLNNIYSLYSLNLKRIGSSTNFIKFFEKDEFSKIIDNIVKIELKFEYEKIDKRLINLIQYFIIILFFHLAVFILYYNFIKIIKFYYSKIDLV